MGSHYAIADGDLQVVALASAENTPFKVTGQVHPG
jgi:hypothetical protein